MRPKPCRLALYSALRWRVAQKLALQWSPQQISGWLKQEFPTHQDMRISHEAIYRSLFIQTRGVLKKELSAQLRTARRMRHPKSHNAKSGQGHILDMVSIRERPAEIEDRAVPGHWEGDLLTGANDTHIATLVERNTRFTMLIKIPRKDTTTVVAALAKHISKLPEELRRSLTWDQGKEMHAHKRFTVATNVQVYFCDPRSPWQRGSNENTNGLLRQYLRRGTDFSRISQSYLTRLLCGSINVRERPWASKREPIDCKRCCMNVPALAVDRTFQIPVENSLKGAVPSNWWLHASWRDQTLRVFVSLPTQESFDLGRIRPGKKRPWKTSAKRSPSPSGTRSSRTRTSPSNKLLAAMAAKAAFSSRAENLWLG